MPPSLNLKLGRRSEENVVGLDIQPGLVAAVQARVNGSIVATRAATLPLAADVVREGDVADPAVLSETLRELFASGHLGKRVRVGVANQRTVMRTLELPPLSDSKELAAAVRFQAQDQVPMPLANAVLDFHPLGVVDTPAGARQRVVLVAAQRDMIERLLASVRAAGLTPIGVDMSAFALIRSLYRAAPGEEQARTLYLNVDGLTNVAIAEGTVCRFTRVLGGGLEEIAAELAERRGVPLAEARELLARIDLHAPEPEPPAVPETIVQEAASETDVAAAQDEDAEPLASDDLEPPTVEAGDQEPQADAGEQEVRTVLENGIRAISGEVRNSLDFHRAQEGGGEVDQVVLSGVAVELPGFAEALESSLRVPVRPGTVSLADPGMATALPTNRLAIATGLAAAEAPR
jgi:type IV pilus assembly protein PilM